MAVATARLVVIRAPSRQLVIPVGLVVAAALLTVVSLSLGTRRIPLEQLPAALFDPTSPSYIIVHQFRLPRVALTWLVGGGLAVAGGVLQGVIRNPLAAPDIIGITKGAGLGAVLLLITIADAPIISVPIAAFVGGVAAFGLVYLFAYRRGTSPARLALVGIAVSAVCESGIRFVLVRFPLDINAALVWLSGSFFGRQLQDVLQILPWVVVLVPLVLLYSHRLDVLGLGDDVALGLGERVERTRTITLLLAVALASSCVAVAGTLGFVGLIAPHMARRLVGYRHAVALPTAGLIGVLITLLADTIGRSIAPPLEIPAGVVTAVVGAPYFLYLLAQTGRRGVTS